MDHKKITLSPDDLKKLQALLAKAEVSVDAMSDEELEAEEKALEARIRKLPQLQGESSADDKERLDASWQKLQKQLNPSTREELSQIENDNVVPFARPKKTLPWATMGMLAAAALALLVFYPILHKNQATEPGDLSQLQTKGVGDEGQHSYTAFCDVDVRGPAADNVEEAGAGQGYEVDANARFSISVSCDKAGYIQVWSQSSPAAEVRNSKVEANLRSFVVEDGKPAEFTLSGASNITLEMALTDKEVLGSVDLLEVPLPAEHIGDANVTWTDSVVFREKK